MKVSPESGERITASRFSRAVGGVVSERLTHRIGETAGLRLVKRKGFEQWALIRAVLMHFQNRSESVSAEIEQDKALTIRAQRETAQLDAAQKKGELVPVEAFDTLWDDYQLQMVDVIKRADIPIKARNALIAKLREIEVKEPAE